MTDDSSATRRRYLRTAGATALLGAVAGCGQANPEEPPGSGGTSRSSPGSGGERSTSATPGDVDTSGYETVIDVARAGADTSGEEPIDSLLTDAMGDDTLLYFPSGRYRVGVWDAKGYRNLAIVGDDATLVPPTNVNYWLRWGELSDFRFEGFTVDCRGDNVAPVMHVAVHAGENVVRDVTVAGHRDAPRIAFEVEVLDRDGSLLLENVSLPDGSSSSPAIYVYPRSVGELTFRNCRIEHWEEGLYAAYHRGPLRVLGGYYANNGIEQVRVGGGTSGALVRGVTVRVDNPRRAQNKPNMRGIWAEEGDHVHIENCDIAITDLTGTYSSGGIVVGKQFGEAVVTNTTIRTDVDVDAIRVRNPIESMEGQTIPSMDRLPKRTRFSAENVRITGASESGTAVRADRRDNCTFEGLCVHYPEGSRDGVTVRGAKGCAVRDSTVVVGGEAIATEEADVEISELRTSGSC